MENSPNCIWADGLAARTRPDGLLPNRRSGVGRVDNDAFANENANVGHAVLAVAIRGPEEHITGLGFGAGQMLAETRVILGLRGARDGVVAGRANGILRET